ncbi:MAG: HoxN/HupN/NixA family nickel/cobalt transporter [Verrucomicrobia bacterium]|nr:HoxN/HupN/NixA family nickel/cobalt transporter [Verrucomicrobiota bacterium]
MIQRSQTKFRKQIVVGYLFLILANAGVWVWALLAFHDKPLLFGTALLAYTFGLRHAVDADHIAAIDNVTRKLMQEGKRPITVGFFFSLGHSTIVVIVSLIVYLTAFAAKDRMEILKGFGELVGTSISAFFLISIAIINLIILRNVWTVFKKVRSGGAVPESGQDALTGGGLISRMFRPLFQMLNSPWQMYPVGFLFGLGFDTATEVALLGISAAAAAKNLPLASVAVFPALFTAGMILVDTTDGILMVGAYGWAFINPIRKMYYNLTVTFASVAVALLIGGLELAGLLKDQLSLQGGAWDLVGGLNDNFGNLGFVLIGLFVLSWIGSMVLYRVKGFDRLQSSVAAD